MSPSRGDDPAGAGALLDTVHLGVATAALVAFLAAGVPIFLAMGLWVDATLYDVGARTLLSGGVYYRDLFDTNLPGMVWLHTAVRAVVGWSPQALRAVDLLVFSGIVWLLVTWFRPPTVSRPLQVWMTLAMCAFYFGLPEWTHVQRDIWMLLPALVALRLRRRQLDAVDAGAFDRAATMRRATLEGAAWAAAAWIKPFVAVPALACWGWSWAHARRGTASGITAAEPAWSGLVAGAGLVILPGVAWLLVSGTWPHFWDVFTRWNTEYGDYGVYQLHIRFELWRQWTDATFPWPLVSIPAFLAGIWLVWRDVTGPPDGRRPSRLVLLAAFYVGWVVQAGYVQARPHAYALSSAMFMAIPLLTVIARPPRRLVLAGPLLALAFAFAAAVEHPLLDPERIALWPRAATLARDPELRNRLSLHGRQSPRPDWVALDEVARFLRGRGVGDGDVVCFNDSTHPLYLELDIAPPVRYMQFNLVRDVFRRQRERVRREIVAADARYVVSDLAAIDLPVDGPVGLMPEPWRTAYPWNQPIVFRAGRYLVHEVRHPITDFWLTF